MRRHIPGQSGCLPNTSGAADGLFLVRIEKASIVGSPKRALSLRFAILEPRSAEMQSFSGRLYCTEKALWKLNWFLRDFEYDSELLDRDKIDEKALVDLRGIVPTSTSWINGHLCQNLDAFAPAAEWEALSYLSMNSAAEADQNNGL